MCTILDIVAIPKPRMTRRDKWDTRPCVMTYWAYCDELRLRINQAKLIPTGSFKIVFYLPIPESFSMKKRKSYEGRIHDKKPDLDNLLKAWQDALYQNDSCVYHVEMDKFYSLNPRIEVEFLK